MSKATLSIGQEIVVKPINNRARSTSSTPFIGKIAKIGRLYFHVEKEGRVMNNRFNLETLLEDAGGWSPGYKVYMTEEEYKLEIEESDLRSQLVCLNFQSKTISLEQLREVAKILKLTT